jgi:hypothetical protein
MGEELSLLLSYKILRQLQTIRKAKKGSRQVKVPLAVLTNFGENRVASIRFSIIKRKARKHEI